MRSIAFLTIIIPLWLFRVSAQDIEFAGYYEPQFMGTSYNSDFAQLFTNKLRIDLSSRPSDRLKFAANFDFITYHGKTEWNAADFLPDFIADSIPPQFYPFYSFAYKDTIFLDNAYLKLAFRLFDLTLGKQEISLGTGYVWNPTDLFNYKSIEDPTYEQPGHNAIRIDMPFSRRYNMTMIVTPEDNLRRSTKLIKVKGNVGHFDISAVFIDKNWELSDFTDSTVEIIKRRLYGGDFVGEVLGLGVWGEWGYNSLENHLDFWELDFGLDYTLDDGTYLLAEYYFDGMLSRNYLKNDINDWMRYFAAETKAISSDNLYLYADYPLTDFIHLNNSIVTSLSDWSVSFVPGMNYNLRQNLEMNLFMNVNTGKSGRAYSRDLEQSGLIRLRYYF